LRSVFIFPIATDHVSGDEIKSTCLNESLLSLATRREVYGFILGLIISIAALTLALYAAGMSLLEFGTALIAIDVIWVLGFYFYAKKHADQS